MVFLALIAAEYAFEKKRITQTHTHALSLINTHTYVIMQILLTAFIMCMPHAENTSTQIALTKIAATAAVLVV